VCIDPSLEGRAPLREGKDRGPCARAARQIFGPEIEAALLAAEADTDVTHYFLDLEVIPEYVGSTVTAVRVAGVSTIYVEPTVNGLTTFTVDLQSNLTVNPVTGDVGSWSRLGRPTATAMPERFIRHSLRAASLHGPRGPT
jgi:hypothetical protein